MTDIEDIIKKVEKMDTDDFSGLEDFLISDIKFAKALIYLGGLGINQKPIYIPELKRKAKLTQQEAIRFFDFLQSKGLIVGINPEDTKRVQYYELTMGNNGFPKITPFIDFSYKFIDGKTKIPVEPKKPKEKIKE
jgi:hypothetical protein